MQVGLIKKSLPYSSPGEVKYEFKLLYRSSRDDLDPDIFHQKCDNISKTLVVTKVQNSDQLVGGSNPLNWNGYGIYKSTTESFIFNISNRNDVKLVMLLIIIVIMQFIVVLFFYFGFDSDIYFYSNNNYTGGIGTASSTYNNINIMYGSKFDELEVFQIIDKN